jgi:ketosteroid isomerase-like protein
VLEDQRAAWNRGDIRAFMEAYAGSDETTFVGKTVTRGRTAILDDYLKRYTSRERMGTLEFSEIEVRPLCAEFASVLGRWQLTRAPAAGGNAGGRFTLVMRKLPAGWKIVLDHTS